MHSHPEDNYSLDADLHEMLVKARGVDGADKRIQRVEPSVENLTAATVRLHEEVVKVLPENPWYLTILAATLIGVIAAFLYRLV